VVLVVIPATLPAGRQEAGIQEDGSPIKSGITGQKGGGEKNMTEASLPGLPAKRTTEQSVNAWMDHGLALGANARQQRANQESAAQAPREKETTEKSRR
jgi:hypothetical protein